ncbi:MAG TPA: glycoside hydrolase [Clostridiaceae bacterium]|nr:glycoside hydrolase [Clostridiaceae bacterium]
MMFRSMLTRIRIFVTIIIFVLCLATTLPASVTVYASKAANNKNKFRFNMSYIYFGNIGGYINSVNKTKDTLDEIAPNYFELNSDGSLKLTHKLDINFIEEMHSRNIRVVPFLSNHWDYNLGRAALSNRIELVKQIVKAVKDYNLDGVNVDLENLKEYDRDDYTDFVRRLRQNLPSDKIVAVSVAPNPWGINKGWQGSYDYKALGEYSDYLMIMAYDEHYEGGLAGPVASYDFVEGSIKYALKYVPKEKIVLGLPFYGRMWKHGDIIGGQGVNLTTVKTLIERYNGKVYFDYYYKSPCAVITINPWDSKPIVMGKTLGAGIYTIWFENEASIKYKLQLVNKYDLKGTGSWSLGQETPDIWDYYDLWLNGYYYTDVQGHWAKKQIMEAASNGWMIGDGKSNFLPNRALTRAEVATAFVRALSSEGFMENRNNKLEVSGAVSVFNDISGHWAEKYIKEAAKYGLILGRGNNTFGPDDKITREELAVMVDRILTDREVLAGRSEAHISEDRYYLSYIDISPESNIWSYESIKRLTYLGIFRGTPDSKFLPYNSATRAELATLLCRIIG